MLGETLLAGEGFDLRLSGGRFCGLTMDGRDLTPARPAYSRLSVDGRTLPFRTTTAFSYEDAEGTGLREELTVEPGGRLVVDYSFRGERPRLSVDGSATLPSLRAESLVEEWIPLAVTLVEVAPGWGIDIEIVAPDGSRGSRRLVESDGWQMLAGASFATAGIVLEAEGQPSWMLMLFRISRGNGRRRFLEASPVGVHRARPVGGLSGRTVSFAFTLGVRGP
jgi:hypothetical protein